MDFPLNSLFGLAIPRSFVAGNPREWPVCSEVELAKKTDISLIFSLLTAEKGSLMTVPSLDRLLRYEASLERAAR